MPRYTLIIRNGYLGDLIMRMPRYTRIIRNGRSTRKARRVTTCNNG